MINGCSELFRDIWGEDLGVALAVPSGMVSLPLGMATEIEAIFELAPKGNVARRRRRREEGRLPTPRRARRRTG